ncbi:MAG: copper amine oxidase N-terminal domain-containing protein [Clostridiales bacterium]|nr:copper amine oxidase N-terminal domain-containing protein [Clostridiales bacterium]
MIKKTKERAKGFVIGFVAAMVLSSAVMVAAGTGAGVMREIFYGVNIMINGATLELAEDMQPFIMDGRTFLPARIIEQITQMPVNWDGETQTVHIGRMPIDEEALLGRWRAVRITLSYHDDFLGETFEEIVEAPYNAYITFFADGTFLATDDYGPDQTSCWEIRDAQLFLDLDDTGEALLFIGFDVVMTGNDLTLTMDTWMYSMTTELTRAD